MSGEPSEHTCTHRAEIYDIGTKGLQPVALARLGLAWGWGKGIHTRGKHVDSQNKLGTWKGKSIRELEDVLSTFLNEWNEPIPTGKFKALRRLVGETAAYNICTRREVQFLTEPRQPTAIYDVQSPPRKKR